MNTYLIYFDLKLFNEIEATSIGNIIADRIVRVGERYSLGKNLFLVKTDSLAVDVYQAIARPFLLNGEDAPREFNNIYLVVTQISTDNAKTIGVWNVELWRFLGLFADVKPEDSSQADNNNQEP